MYISENKKRWLTEPTKKVPQKSESIQMRPLSQRRIKNLAELFEGSEFYPIAERFLAELFLKFPRAKKAPSEKHRTFRVYSETIRV